MTQDKASSFLRLLQHPDTVIDQDEIARIDNELARVQGGIQELERLKARLTDQEAA